ncbi:MAG: ECF transporter S component [Candidatus Hodarchaeota archaeon]
MSDSQFSIKEVVTMREVAMTAAFIAMVFLSTSLFYIALVSSTGFFNLGEAFVYLAALIGGPIVGALAGGIGAAMADMVLGYGYFAPATLVFKGLEGFAAGFFYKKGQQISQRIRYIFLAGISIFLIAFSIFVILPDLQLLVIDIIKSSFDVPPEIEAAQGSSTVQGGLVIFTQEVPFEFDGIIIFLVVLLLIGIIWFIELRLGEKGQMILSCLLAGPIIVVGYFLYEVFILGVPFGGALFEIPFNIAQVVFGIVIAVPIVSYLRELGILTKEKNVLSSDEQ